jgi:hypothetical protein
VRTYYLGPDAAVTDELFIWQARAGAKAFAVADLRADRVRQVRQDRSRLGQVGAGVLLAVAGAVWVQLTLPGRWYVGIGALVAALVVAGWPPHTRSFSLRTAYRDAGEVTLYTTADPRVFHQVRRALLRAIEDAR